MDYRDERDALRGRVENLEQDLAGAREELARGRGDDKQKRIEDIERKMADARRVLDEMGGELDELRGKPKPKPNRAGTVIALTAGIVVAAGGASFLLIKAPARPPPRRISMPAHNTTPPVTAAPAPIPKAEPQTPARETVRASARWTATVKRATGLAIAPGSTCTIDASLESTGREIRVLGTVVTCGNARVYDSAEPLNGMASLSSGVEEDAGEQEGTYRYALSYEDMGTRTGKRAQGSINTIAKAASVWSESAPAYRVDLIVPYQSEPVKGQALLLATTQVLRRGATVKAVSGQSPVRVGARCTLRVTPGLKDGTRCLARLRCGESMIYGAGTTGVAQCTVEGDKVVSFIDRETTPNGGDPQCEVDVAAGTVKVADEIGSTKWSVDLGLDPE